MGELRDSLRISPQMLMQDVETEEIISDLIDQYGMTTGDLLDIFGDIEKVRGYIQDYAWFEYEDPLED